MKRGGFNLIDIKEEDKSIGDIIGKSMNMREERPRKRKAKPNFDHLFPMPKNNKNMGMQLDNEVSMFGECTL